MFIWEAVVYLPVLPISSLTHLQLQQSKICVHVTAHPKCLTYQSYSALHFVSHPHYTFNTVHACLLDCNVLGFSKLCSCNWQIHETSTICSQTYWITRRLLYDYTGGLICHTTLYIYLDKKQPWVVALLPMPWDRKIRSCVLLGPEPRTTVPVRASSNLPNQTVSTGKR
jgi:hypothetical protein